MKKSLQFFLSLVALMLMAVTVNAQEDVTSTYLKNSDFSSGTPIDNHVCTYGKDMEGNGTTYYGAQPITDWTNASVGAEDSGYENSKLAGAIFTYGSESWLAGAGNTAPATDPEGKAGNAAGLCAVWGGSIQYTQAVTFPAGSYTVKFYVYNTTTGDGNSSGVITTNLFGFVEDGETTHYAPNNTFAIGQWSTIAVTFNLDTETTGKISMGYVGPSGGAAMPHLFVDKVQILRNEMFEDCTNKVKKDGWTGAFDGYQGGSINTARQYGDKSIGRHIYQTVSGLENGSYEVTLYSISQKEWNGTLANDAGDVAYVFAEGAYELTEWINARARAAYPGDANLGIYTISGVKVTEGTMTLGMGLAQANLTEWHHVQIKSLVRTNAPDLTDFIAAYNTAKDAAKAVDQTQTMTPSILTALQNAISTYETVDETSQSDLEAATAALNAATAAANTSIASYAIIASGTVPTNSTDGWSDTGTGSEFRVNTWSVEGNSDGSSMTTPFVQTWIYKDNKLKEGTASYTLEGLEPGEVYYAQALVRAYNEGSSDAPNGPNFFINDVETDMTQAGTTFTYNGMSGIYATLGGAATVGSDGKITLGVKIASDANYNWVAFKNVSIQSMDDALAAAVAKAEALEGKVPESVYAEISSVITEYNKKWSTADEYETAIAKITEAVVNGTKIAELYTKLAELKAQAEELKVNTDLPEVAVGALEDALTATESIENTEDAYNEAIAILQTAIDHAQAYVNAKAYFGKMASVLDNTNVYTKEAYDAVYGTWLAEYNAGTLAQETAATLNEGAAFSNGWHAANNIDDVLLSAWTIGGEQAANYDKALYINTWSVEGDNDGTNFKAPFFEYWTGDANSLGANTIAATLEGVPAGDYAVKAWVRVRYKNGIESAADATGITLQVNDGEAVDVTEGEQVGTSQFLLAEYTAYGKVGEDGTLKINFNVANDNNISWLSFKNVTYEAVPALTLNEEVDNTATLEENNGKKANVTLTRTLKTGSYNSFAVPFNIDAIPTGWTVKKLTSSSLDAEGLLSLEFENATSIEAGKPYLVKVASEVANPTFDGVTISSTTTPTKTDAVDFIPTVGATTLSATENDPENFLFIGAGNKLYNPSELPQNMKGFRAYFYVKNIGTESAKVRTFNLDFGDGETTGIIELRSEKAGANGEGFYDLMGRSIQGQPTQKGVYIKNGKKVIVK